MSYGNITIDIDNIIYFGIFTFSSMDTSIITNCINNINIILSGSSGSYMGGMAYSVASTAKILNNINNGNLQSTGYAGGIVGHINSTTPFIQGNKNYGGITTTRTSEISCAGGIIGRLDDTTTVIPTITNNTNYGVITSYSETSPACGIASGIGQNTGFTHGGWLRNPTFYLLCFAVLAKFRFWNSSFAFPTSCF